MQYANGKVVHHLGEWYPNKFPSFGFRKRKLRNAGNQVAFEFTRPGSRAVHVVICINVFSPYNSLLNRRISPSRHEKRFKQEEISIPYFILSSYVDSFEQKTVQTQL